MKVKFNLDGFAERNVIVEFDDDATADMINEALDDWVNSKIDRWYEIIEQPEQEDKA